MLVSGTSGIAMSIDLAYPTILFLEDCFHKFTGEINVTHRRLREEFPAASAVNLCVSDDSSATIRMRSSRACFVLQSLHLVVCVPLSNRTGS